MDWAGVVDASDWPVDIQEPAGSSENLWLVDIFGETWLFKPNRIHANGHEQGEDWAELIAHRVAHDLGVPAAVVRMGFRRDGSGRRDGALSANVVPAAQRAIGYEMQTGGVLLSGESGFQIRRSDGSGRPVRDHVGHTVPAVLRCLDGVGPPSRPPSPFDARGTFAGYLLLDALIGNQDRHEQNWGVVVAPDGSLTLAPSFDHGAALGFGMMDDQALHRAGPEVTRGWLSRVGDLTPAALEAIVQAAPRMSDLARTFCLELLLANRRRLLDVAR